jgi:hypothetical protein
MESTTATEDILVPRGRLRPGSYSQIPSRYAKQQVTMRIIGSPDIVDSEVSRQRRELSVGVRKSETVALGHPVMPVGDGFCGRIVGINSHQL